MNPIASTQQHANNIVPEAFGVAIPSNPTDLLKFIQLQKQQQKLHTSLQAADTSTNNPDIAQERLKKQDHEREKYEGTLMEQEDAFSENLIVLFKEYDQERLREKIRKEIEQRKLQELAEREARKKAAEERRAAVVERIRKQKELEEQRKRDAELALLRIEEEKLRKIQQEKDRLIANQEQMILEDQYSMLVEQEYREYLEKKIWQQREKERLFEWEKEQKRKDAIEEEARKARLKELEEKKKKLELLRQQQQQQQQKANTATTSAKDQGDKLNKQLRIQNRAKFVSKKIAESNNAVEQVLEVIDHNSSNSQINHLLSSILPVPSASAKPDSKMTTPRAHDDAGSTKPPFITRHQSVKALDAIIFQSPPTAGIKDTPSSSGGNLQVPTSFLNRQSSLKLQGDHQLFHNPESAAEIRSYEEEIARIDSETVLKQLQNEFMVQKRSLRIEQRQKIVHQIEENTEMNHPSNAANVSLTNLMNDSTKQKLFILTEKMAVVERRLHLLQAQQQSKLMTGTTTEMDVNESKSLLNSAGRLLSRQSSLRMPPPTAQTASSEEKRSTRTTGIAMTSSRPSSGQPKESTATVKPPTPQHHHQTLHHSTQTNQTADIFKQCETLIRNTNKYLTLSTDVRSTTKNSPPAQISEAITTGNEMIHHLTSLSLEILQTNQKLISVNQIHDYDPLGYREKLPAANDRITKSIPKIQDHVNILKAALADLSETAQISPRPSSSGSQKRPVKIYSRTNSASNNTPSSAAAVAAAAVATSPRSESAAVLSSDVTSRLTENKLMSSFSAPTIPTLPIIISETKKSSPRPEEPVISITNDNITQALQVGTNIASEVAKDKESSEESSSSEVDPTKLPGWEECIYTSMFSAAHHAAFFGYAEVLSFLCQYFDCFIMDKKGRTPLFYAALNNRLDCVTLLLALDPQWIDVGDEKGDTILHAATISNSLQVLAFLLSCEVHPDITNYSGLTSAHLSKSKEALILLQNAGAQLYCVDNLSRTPLWYACSDGRNDCCEYLCMNTPAEFLLWKDSDGETSLHIAAMKGNAKCIEMISQYLLTIDELNISNHRGYTPAHIACNAQILQSLYENGANLWISDSKKGRMPLFVASFFGRMDCVAFLLEIASNHTNSPSKSGKNPSQQFSSTQQYENIRYKDKQGDTALHVAALCGHLACVHLLLFYLSNEERNVQSLRPSDLAYKAKHDAIGQLIERIEALKATQNTQTILSPSSSSSSSPSLLPAYYEKIFGTNDFHYFASIILYYHSRWGIAYDTTYQAYYYIDYITNSSQWERPELLDLPIKAETNYQKACQLLIQFYQQYNPEKMTEIPAILAMYLDNYTNLFITLANKYQIQDLSIFSGINFE